MTRLIIARHGNTFGPTDTPTRVGAHTDIPLVQSGVDQAKAIGQYFEAKHIMPDVVYSSELKRTQQTAAYAVKHMPITSLSCFNEIDYGPDENKTEPEVIARIGQAAIDAWNLEGVVPPGWKVNPGAIIQDWMKFGDMVQKEHENQTVFVVTSNGIARFAPYLTGDFEHFCKNHSIKLKTGALSAFYYTDNAWHVDYWNMRP
ncbi:MAG: histidine phosphatase family protein [Legionellaceae bacterium]|nr:histidine phosphatase family protein [Legionellaceae bacterium]